MAGVKAGAGGMGRTALVIGRRARNDRIEDRKKMDVDILCGLRVYTWSGLYDGCVLVMRTFLDA